ncbi:TPA: hypothetical protein ACOJPH_000507 [Vibrio campbellii]|uniref:hypothetical protein n=1 Tax=Vibrio campbellii TaxID=680 RepID=UPI00390B8A9A
MFNFVRVYSFFLINSGLLVSILNIPVTLYLVLDFILISITVGLVFKSVFNRGIQKTTFIIGVLFIYLFFYVALLSEYFDVDTKESIIYTMVLFRFYCLLIISNEVLVRNNNVSFKCFDIYLRDLNIYLIVQFVVILIQSYSPSLGTALIPIVSEKQSSFYVLAEGDTPGSFSNSIELAFFALSVLIFNLMKRGNKNFYFIALAVIIIFMTGSDTALYISIALIFAFFLRFYHDSNLKVIFCSSLLFIVVFIFSSNLDSIYGAVVNKVDNMFLSRLGIMFDLFPRWVLLNENNLILGSMPDFESIALTFYNFNNTLAIFDQNNTGTVINDTYWLALIMAFGLPNFLVLVYVLYVSLKRIMVTVECYNSRFYFFTILMVIFTIGFFNQVLMVRAFVCPLIFGLMLFSCKEKREINNVFKS